MLGEYGGVDYLEEFGGVHKHYQNGLHEKYFSIKVIKRKIEKGLLTTPSGPHYATWYTNHIWISVLIKTIYFPVVALVYNIFGLFVCFFVYMS